MSTPAAETVRPLARGFGRFSERRLDGATSTQTQEYTPARRRALRGRVSTTDARQSLVASTYLRPRRAARSHGQPQTRDGLQTSEEATDGSQRCQRLGLVV